MIFAYNEIFIRGQEVVYYLFWAFIAFTIIYGLVALNKELKKK